ncbi:MAG: hypothetical protein D6734_00610 [Candidatus Schekmanbacteria bacterium]|nr:MAG: hypothetical protein D6734_00610 [Candidatus Schekmanbacteria bacterium]
MIGKTRFLNIFILSLVLISYSVISASASSHRSSLSLRALDLKIVPAKTKIRAGKIKHFRLKDKNKGELFKSAEKYGKAVWYVNGIKWGNKEVGKINKKGKYRAPKYVASKMKVNISVKLSGYSQAKIKAARAVLKPQKNQRGRLLLRVKWKDKGRSARAQQIPEDVKSVKGVAVKEDSPLKGKKFTAGPVNFSESRELIFNVPIGEYTVFLEAFDQENGQGNVIFEGVKKGVDAVPVGANEPEPEPVVIFLTRVDIPPSVSITPASAIVRIKEKKKFNIEVSGVITDVANPLYLFVMPKSSDLKSKLKDFFSLSKAEKDKLLKLWEEKYGSISKNGLYEAPKKAPSKKALIAGILKASLEDEKPGFIYDYAEVDIIPQLKVTVSPSTAELNLGESQQFSATVVGAISDTSVIWSIDGDDGTLGSIDTSGLYTAPSIMPLTSTVIVRAQSSEDSAVSDTAKVILTAPVFNISLTAPDMSMLSIYNLLAISTTDDFSNGAFSNPLTPAQAFSISNTLEVKFEPTVATGWTPLDGTIVDVRTDRILVDIPDGLPFGTCKVAVKVKGSDSKSNPLTITIVPPFDETLYVDNIGGEDTTRGICTDKLYDGNGDFYVTSRSAGGPGDITKISPTGVKTLLSDKVEDVRGLEMNEDGDLFVAEVLAESSYNPPDRLIKIPAGSDTPITNFITTVTEARGVAIGPDGNVYIADKYNGEVLKFSPSGGTGTVVASLSSSINGIDFNLFGDLFITEDDGDTIYKVPAGGSTPSSFATTTHWGTTGVAVDYKGNVYVAERSDHIEVFDPDGNSLGELDHSTFDTLEGIELDLCNNLYVLNRYSAVTRLTAPPLPTNAPTIGSMDLLSLINEGGNDYINMEIKGVNFTSSLVASVGGQAVTTEYINDTTIHALVPANLLAKEGTIEVYLSTNISPSLYTPLAVTAELTSNKINFPIPKEIFVSPSNPFVPQEETEQFKAYVTGLDNQSVVWSVKGGNSFGTITSNGLYTAPSDIPPDGKAEVEAVSSEDSTLKGSVEVSLANLFGKVIDVQTQQSISGATLSVSEITDLSPFTATVTSNTDGNYAFGLPVGEYILQVDKSGYQSYTSSFFVDYITSTIQINPSLSPISQTVVVGSVSGKVTDEGGNPIPGAVVSISGGPQTNGVFATDQTDSKGFYFIDAIPVTDTLGNPIPVFTVTAYADSYETSIQTGITVMPNANTSNVDFSLVPEVLGSIIFSDDFETDQSWVTVVSDTVPTDTISWSRINNPSSIVNSAVPTYVTLPPGDTSGGALPSPPSGNYVLWFGDPATGNYMGKQQADDYPNSGGISESLFHGGAIYSPYFYIPPTSNPELRFKSWFEIEGVNPNQMGYDRMRVLIAHSGSLFDPLSGDEILLLNPYADPVVEMNREDKPYTSSGFNKPPIWYRYQLDLSAYKGEYIRIVFAFDTVDNLFNGFRGWLIDDVEVVNKP